MAASAAVGFGVKALDSPGNAQHQAKSAAAVLASPVVSISPSPSVVVSVSPSPSPYPSPKVSVYLSPYPSPSVWASPSPSPSPSPVYDEGTVDDQETGFPASPAVDTYNGEALAQQIASSSAGKAAGLDALACPDDEPMIPGRTFTCWNGRFKTEVVRVYVTVEGSSGTYSWRVDQDDANAVASSDGDSPVLPSFDVGLTTPSPDHSGATAMCEDGTLSYSAHHQGTCSYHGGVLTWYR